MKKLNIILIILCFILLIFSGICVYYSVTEFQKSEQLYNEAKEYYADADKLCRPAYGVIEKTENEIKICVPKEYIERISPDTNEYEKSELNGDEVYLFTNFDDADAFCEKAKDIIKNDFKEFANSDSISGLAEFSYSTNLEEIIFTLKYNENDAFSAVTDVFLISLYNERVTYYSHLYQSFNSEYKKDITTKITYAGLDSDDNNKPLVFMY